MPAPCVCRYDTFVTSCGESRCTDCIYRLLTGVGILDVGEGAAQDCI